MPELNLGWTGGSIPIGSHVCYYYSDEPMLQRSLEFLSIGVSQPEDALFLFADQSRHESLLDGLSKAAGSDVRSLVGTGKLTVVGGYPTSEELLSNIGQRLDAALAAGYKHIRFLGFIAWGQPGWPNDESLLEFEAKVNDVVSAYPAVVVCTYGVPRLSGTSLIYGGLQTHPQVSMGGAVVENHLYTGSPAGHGADHIHDPEA